MKFGSLFAGVGGFDLGFEAAGFECCWQVEFDKFCQDVLSFRWPDVVRFGDIRDVCGADLEPVDVVTYGFPCQDLSVAGAQAGLDGGRSGLFFEAMRIIKEMRDATGGRFPRVAVAENVVGLLSADGGYAMGRCLDEMAKVGAVGIEWVTLDSQFFGVPQRRRRVFVASFFDSGASERCSGQLFSVEEVGDRRFEEGKESGEGVAQGVAGGYGEDCQFLSFDSSYSGGFANGFKDGISPTVKVGSSVGIASPPAVAILPKFYNRSSFGGYSEGVGCISASDYKRPYQHLVIDGPILRKLTPKECERLMGWPDDHTRFGASGSELSNTQRYKMCGNGVVAPVAEWVARKIASVL